MAEIVIGGVKCLENDGALCIVPNLEIDYGFKSIAEVKAGVLSYKLDIQSTTPIVDPSTIGFGFSLEKIMAYVGVILEKSKGRVGPNEELGLNFYLSNETGKKALNIVPYVRREVEKDQVVQNDFNDFDGNGAPILNLASFELMNKGNAIPPPFNNRVID
jgi:hypothetical protein